LVKVLVPAKAGSAAKPKPAASSESSIDPEALANRMVMDVMHSLFYQAWLRQLRAVVCMLQIVCRCQRMRRMHCGLLAGVLYRCVNIQRQS
jgi:hypothetical protein